LLGKPSLTGGAQCTKTAAALNAAIQEFRGPGTAQANVACAFGGLLYDASDCAAIATTLNALTGDWINNGGFRNCEITSPTTSPTSSATSTGTSTGTTTLTTRTTATTTLACIEKCSQIVLTTDGGDEQACNDGLNWLHRVLEGCGIGLNAACSSDEADMLFTSDQGVGACPGLDDAVNTVIEAFVSSNQTTDFSCIEF
jgi:hypothetical protein